jgi:hypothetical protein
MGKYADFKPFSIVNYKGTWVVICQGCPIDVVGTDAEDDRRIALTSTTDREEAESLAARLNKAWRKHHKSN